MLISLAVWKDDNSSNFIFKSSEMVISIVVESLSQPGTWCIEEFDSRVIETHLTSFVFCLSRVQPMHSLHLSYAVFEFDHVDATNHHDARIQRTILLRVSREEEGESLRQVWSYPSRDLFALGEHTHIMEYYDQDGDAQQFQYDFPTQVSKLEVYC